MTFAELQKRYLPKCSYCEASATERDHVPPRKLSPTNTKTVPACRLCNAILRDVNLITIDARTKFVRQHYVSKDWKKNLSLTTAGTQHADEPKAPEEVFHPQSTTEATPS